jgi:hypothetical protein
LPARRVRRDGGAQVAGSDLQGAGSGSARDRPAARPRSSTVSRELRRNAATRGRRLDYRASVAQWKAELVARRPRTAKLTGNDRLREYVQERLSGPGPADGWDAGRGPGGDTADGPEQAASRGPEVGDGLEPGADLPPAEDRLP